MYKIINEDLRIMSCSISDLSEEQKALFVEQFNGDSIDTMTMFLDISNCWLILNHDNADFELYKSFSEAYLAASEEARKKVDEKYRSENNETLHLLYEVTERRKAKKLVEDAKKIQSILGKHTTEVYGENYNIIYCLRQINKYQNGFFDYYDLFMYGYIQGIRAERARRKGKISKKAGGAC